MQISPLGSAPTSPSVSLTVNTQQPGHYIFSTTHFFLRVCVCVCPWFSAEVVLIKCQSPGALTRKEEGADCCQLPAFSAAVSVYTQTGA